MDWITVNRYPQKITVISTKNRKSSEHENFWIKKLTILPCSNGFNQPAATGSEELSCNGAKSIQKKHNMA